MQIKQMYEVGLTKDELFEVIGKAIADKTGQTVELVDFKKSTSSAAGEHVVIVFEGQVTQKAS